MKIAILTSPNQWFISYAKELQTKLDNAKLFFNHKEIDDSFNIVFILSYHKIIEEKYLQLHKHNIVVHESDLPSGKGWAPMFWQILEDKNIIPFSMFEASSGVDDGDIYMTKDLHLTGYELNQELREKQAKHTIDMCLEFINNYEKYNNPIKQNGKETFYKKRDAKDSYLDINKTIKEQFNLLRIVDNENYPAFFELDGHRYILKIELEDVRGGVKLIDFVDMDLSEKEMVLSWRNDAKVKKWMYNQDISLDNHLKFINTLDSLKDKQYILIQKDNIYIGVVYFTNIDIKNKSIYFGLYANPFEKFIGVGKILQEICVKYAFDILKLTTLKLDVFSENKRAIKLYKKFNFKEIDRKVVNGSDIICMELKNRYNK